MAQNQEFEIFHPSEDHRIAALTNSWTIADLWMADLYDLVWALALRDDRGDMSDEEFGVLVRRLQREAAKNRDKDVEESVRRWTRRFLKELSERWPALIVRIEEQARESSLSEPGQLAIDIGELLDAACSIYPSWRKRRKQVILPLRKKLDLLRNFTIHAAPQLTPRETQAWLVLWLVERKGTALISVRRVAEYCGTSPATACTALRGLQSKELVQRRKRWTVNGWCSEYKLRPKNDELAQAMRQAGGKIVGSPVSWIKYFSDFVRNGMRRLRPVDAGIWITIACHVMEGSPCIAYARLAKRQNKCLRTVINSIKRLTKHEYLRVLEKWGPRRATKYTIIDKSR